MTHRHDKPAFPVYVPITAYRGDDLTRLFLAQYKDPADDTLKPVDMTGWTGKAQVRESDKDGAAVLVELTTGNGQIITGPQPVGDTTFQLTIYFTAEQMASFPPGFVGYWDIELIKIDGKKQTWYGGPFCVEGDITKGGD